MEHYRLGEDEAVALISLGVDFGITQVADGNWGVHAIVRKKMFGERAVSIKNGLMHRGKLFGHLLGRRRVRRHIAAALARIVGRAGMLDVCSFDAWQASAAARQRQRPTPS